VCQEFPDRAGKGPCLDDEYESCTHRPKIVSEWLPYKQDE
jgi:hypothetical protein